ncbi:MAG: FAD-dependent monooxygenase [Beijerinckiaceae bacterium]
MAKKYDVIIAGGGPVGVALAVTLALRGHSSAIVERRKGMHNIPKGQNLTHRTLEHFWFWGIENKLRDARLMPPGHAIGEILAYGNMMSDYWHAPAGRELVTDYYFRKNDRIPQYILERVLRERMNEFGCIDQFFGWRVESFEQDADGVRVTMIGEDGESETLEGAYVVGCDGGHSVVRQQMGVERGGTDFDELMVLAVFRSKQLHEAFKRFPDRSTYRAIDPALKGYWKFFGRIDVGEGWFFHMPVPKGRELSDAEVKALIEEAAGLSFDCEFDHIGYWDLRVAVAERYRAGRAFIAGDAAHTHPPYGGFGVNNGLEDAVNLGWKIGAKLEGWGGETLLDSYDLERRPVFRDVGEDFIAGRIKREAAFLDRYNPHKNREEFEAAWQAHATGDLGAIVQSYEPNYEGSSVVAGPPGGKCTAHGKHAMKARAGHHLGPLKLSDGRNVFEALGRGFTLLAFDADASSVAAFEAAAHAHNVPLEVVRDTFGGGREAFEARLILVRPDQFVAWCGDAGDAGRIVPMAAGA